MMLPKEKRLENVKGWLRGCRDSLLFHLFGLLPVQQNKITVISLHGKGYGDNPKYIIEELLYRHEVLKGKNQYRIVWFVNNMDSIFPESVIKVKNTAWNRAFHLSTAKVWIGNVRKTYGTKKRRQQLYIQTWHGPIGFKPVGALMNLSDNLKIVYKARVNDSKMADYFISNSRWCSNMYRKAFYYNGKILESGSPRCDVFFHSNKRLHKEIRAYYGIPEDAYILIYAPTFRGSLDKSEHFFRPGNCNLDYNRLLKTLDEHFGGDWYIFLRSHHLLKDYTVFTFSEYQTLDKIRDISNEEDLYQILAVADALITDYSSVAFDAAYNKLPVFLYANDLEEYERERGDLLWNMNELPFMFAQTQMELFDNINKFDVESYFFKLEKLFQQVGLIEDGHASQRVADIIDEFLDRGTKQ